MKQMTGIVCGLALAVSLTVGQAAEETAKPHTAEEAWRIGWPNWHGPYDNGSAVQTGVELLDDLSKVRLLWTSEEKVFPQTWQSQPWVSNYIERSMQQATNDPCMSVEAWRASVNESNRAKMAYPTIEKTSAILIGDVEFRQALAAGVVRFVNSRITESKVQDAKNARANWQLEIVDGGDLTVTLNARGMTVAGIVEALERASVQLGWKLQKGD